MKTQSSPGVSEAARLRVRAEACTLLLIDIQEKLLPAIYQREQLVRNTQLLLRLAKTLDIPILVTEQYSKGLGATVPEIASLLPSGVHVIDKQEFGCFGNGQFCSAVKSVASERNTLLLCGLETHICVMQSALGALEKGYLVHVASDAVGSRSEWNWKTGLERMQAAGALISSTEMMIYELLGGSGTAAFRKMLPYLKS
jgi:nicotinamidase-related amidase